MLVMFMVGGTMVQQTPTENSQKKSGMASIKEKVREILPQKQKEKLFYLGALMEENDYIKRALNKFEGTYKNLPQTEAKELLNKIYEEYKKALKRNDKEQMTILYDILQKLQAKRDDVNVIKMSPILKTKAMKQELNADGVIRIISIDLKNNENKLMSWLKNLKLDMAEQAALLVELEKRGLIKRDIIFQTFERLSGTVDEEIINRIINGQTAVDAIADSIPEHLRETYEKHKGNTLSETIKNIDNRIDEIKDQIKRNRYVDQALDDELKTLNELKNEVKKFIEGGTEALEILGKRISTIAEEELRISQELAYLNRPFSFNLGIFKKPIIFGLVAGGLYGIYELAETPWASVTAFIFGIGTYSTYKKAKEVEGLRARIRRTGPIAILWATLTGVSGYLTYEALQKKENELQNELMKEYKLSREEIKRLGDFAKSKEGKAVINYLKDLRGKMVREGERLDFNKLEEWLKDEKTIGSFKNLEYFIKALLEIAPLVKNKNEDEIKRIINQKIDEFKQKGYLYNKGESVLFEYGLAIGLSEQQIEKLLSSAENKKEIVELLKAVYEGRLPQSYAMIYAEFILQGKKEEAEKLLLQQPIQKNSALDHLDRYTLGILMDPNKDIKEKQNTKRRLDEIIKWYNTNETYRNNLNQPLGENVIYGDDKYGCISAIMRGDITIEQIANGEKLEVGYIIANPLLAMIDKRFISDARAANFVNEYGLLEFIKGYIKENKIGIDAYGLVKELENDKTFRAIDKNKRKEWLKENLEKGLLKKYLKTKNLERTYMANGIETAPPAIIEKKDGKRAPPSNTPSQVIPKKREPPQPVGRKKVGKKEEGGGKKEEEISW